MVAHPRYGTESKPSGYGYSEKDVRASFYGYRSAEIFPASAIPADITRQNYTTFPRAMYVDILKTCVACQRSFIFFAREQTYWYEELRFYVDADCVRCITCRRSEQELSRRTRRYAQAIAKKELTKVELETLVEDVVYLWRADFLKDEQRLRALRNRARRRIPNSKVIKRIDKLIDELANA